MPQFPRPTDSLAVRANDLDRATVCASLDSAYADGELDAAEHEQRVNAAMFAKTRGQLVGLVNDLQAPLPAFITGDMDLPPAGPRPRTVFLVAGGAMLALGIAGIAFAIQPSTAVTTSVTPSSTVASTASVPVSSGDFVVNEDQLERTLSSDFQDAMGHSPDYVGCNGDLRGEVGAVKQCTVVADGKNYPASVTVTKIQGNTISYHTSIDDLPGN